MNITILTTNAHEGLINVTIRVEANADILPVYLINYKHWLGTKPLPEP